MKFALDSARSRAAEQRAVAAGISLATLMERAGEAVALEAANLCVSGRIVVVTGGGNNGGDGWVAARHLLRTRRDVEVIAFADPSDLAEPARSAAIDAVEAGVAHRIADGPGLLASVLPGACLVVDALLGIGTHGEVREPIAGAIAAMVGAGVPVLAIDVPSGLDADTGRSLGPVAPAVTTVTFSALKPGLLLYPGAAFAGRVFVADLGIESSTLFADGGVEVWDSRDCARLLRWPEPEDNKGTRGRVLVVGGSRGMSGAAVLASSGALRSGAGYVVAAVPACIADIVDAKVTSAVTVGLPDDSTSGALALDAADRVLALAERADAIVLGPGMSASAAVRGIVSEILRGARVPAVVDADALNALAGDMAPLLERDVPTIITPHPGEAGRLLGVSPQTVQSDRLRWGRTLASGSLVSLLKGARTVVTGGDRQAIVTTGNPGLATAGTGDVLSGIIGTLLAQGLDAFDAAVLGAWIHGRSGDRASAAVTAPCVIADDVVAHLPDVFRELSEASAIID